MNGWQLCEMQKKGYFCFALEVVYPRFSSYYLLSLLFTADESSLRSWGTRGAVKESREGQASSNIDEPGRLSEQRESRGAGRILKDIKPPTSRQMAVICWKGEQ